jgi:hypothetical protein
MDTSASQDIKQFYVSSLKERHRCSNNVEAKAKKIYERALQKLAVKGETLRMLFNV